jgi:hypothetical protein
LEGDAVVVQRFLDKYQKFLYGAFGVWEPPDDCDLSVTVDQRLHSALGLAVGGEYGAGVSIKATQVPAVHNHTLEATCP